MVQELGTATAYAIQCEFAIFARLCHRRSLVAYDSLAKASPPMRWCHETITFLLKLISRQPSMPWFSYYNTRIRIFTSGSCQLSHSTGQTSRGSLVSCHVALSWLVAAGTRKLPISHPNADRSGRDVHVKACWRARWMRRSVSPPPNKSCAYA